MDETNINKNSNPCAYQHEILAPIDKHTSLNHVSNMDPSFITTETLKTEPLSRKEIDTVLLEERQQQSAVMDTCDVIVGMDNNNNNTLIERRRGTCLYLEPSIGNHTIKTTKTLVSTKEPIFTPKQPCHSILAQIERQNALLEKDQKSICIQSNELRGHYSTVQQLVSDYQPLLSPPLSNNDDSDTFDTLIQQQQTMDWAFWQALIQDSLHVANKTPHLLSIKLRAGIPPHARGLIWQAVCQSDCLHLETVYGQLCKEHSPHERVIKRDLTRTFPNVDMFKEENGPGQLALYRILVAYSLYDAHVGYCQGLAFLVGPLLMNMPEPQAFCVFVRMMETYEMRSMFTLDMEGLQVRLYQFSRLLEEHIPNLAAHLNKHSIHAAMYASQWFLTLFAYAFPLDLVSRIYDILFVEGATETMMRVSIAMLQRSEQAILAEDEFEDLLDCVTTRKLCAHYQEDLVRSHLRRHVSFQQDHATKLDGLEQQYAQQGQQEKKKTEQVLVSRLGNFWRRKSTKSSLARSVSDGGGGNNGGTGRSMKKKNTGINQTRNSIHSVDNVYSSVVMPPTPLTAASTNDHHDDITEELLQALEQLRREHSRTIDELFETRMDKKDVESERDALKMTIMELERRYQTSPPQSVPLDTTISSDSTIINDQPLTLLEDDDVNNDNTLVSYSNNVISTTSSYQTSSTDDLFYELASSSKKGVSQLTGTSLLTTTDESDGNALRTELVRIKVDHFESQQQCERLGQEVEDLQSRLDMVNEGQLALVDKLVSMKSEMDDLLLYKKRQDEKWQDLVEENSQLTIQLQQQQPAMDYLVDRIDELETSLAATKVRLAELEASADHRPSDHMILSTSLTNDGVSINDGGRLARSGSLYGRMWHVISPRSQALKSS